MFDCGILKVGNYDVSIGGISMKTNCNQCGNEIEKTPYQIRTYKKHYCNNKCASESRIKRVTKPCYICGEKVTRKPSQFTEFTYCSRDCYHISTTNKHTGEYSKVACNCSYCGVNFDRYPSQVKGKKYTYCGMNCKDKHNGVLFRRESHPSWNHNLTDEERINNRKTYDYIDWRKKVFSRDDFTCKCCGDNKGGNLEAHHILNYSEHEHLKLDLNNGLTMCKTCHKGFHDEFGYTKNNKKQLIDYLQR